jgi:NhaP-type Na+/H+ or K+/H+ antiporter
MGNLPDEISWFLHRIKSGWGYVALLLIFVQFALPFAMLLSRDLKRNPHKLIPVAVIVMVGRWIDMYWYFVPNSLPGGTPPSLHFHWSYLFAIAGLGGIWVAAFCTFLVKRPLLVRNEPMLPRLWEPSHGH